MPCPLKQAEGGEAVGGAVPPGAGRLLPESWPQFFLLPPKCGPVEAEKGEPGEQDEQDEGKDSGETPGREPSQQLLVFHGQLPAPAPARTLLSRPIPRSHRPQSFPRGMGAACCPELDPRQLRFLRLGAPPPPTPCLPKPFSIESPLPLAPRHSMGVCDTLSPSLPAAQLQPQQEKLSLVVGVRSMVVHAMQEVLWSR